MRHFKHFFLLALIIVNFHNSFSQNERRYKSKEEDVYYDSINRIREYKNFTPVSKEVIKNHKFDYVKITNVDHPSIYNPLQVFPRYWDSVMIANKVEMKDFIKFDSILQVPSNEKVGIIPKMSIIKEEKHNKNWAIIYTDSKYDDFIYGGSGYWIALSRDNGKNWNQYYTNLTENYNYFFKRNSSIPLWKDSTTIQIEAVIKRNRSEFIHPMPVFKTIQDSIAVQLDLSKIIIDSDKDGLIDIVEDRMLLNPKNPDTDGDGISDNEDKNPRFKSVQTELATIYEVLIENFHPNNNKGEMIIDLSKPPVYKVNKDILYEDFETVNLLIADDKDLQGISLYNTTMIILSNAEYDIYKKQYPAHFIKNNFSPMFKCDKIKDTYKINTSHLTGGATFVIQKIKTGWKIFMLSIWIS